MFTSILFSLGSAVCWGIGDFSGGLASRKANVFKVVLLAHSTGLLMMLLFAAAAHEALPPLRDLAWGIAAGISGTIGLVALYRGLAVGTMGVVAPLTAVLTAVIPMTYAMVTNGLPRNIQLLGFSFAAVGIILISRPEKASGMPKGIGFALLASAGFGGFLTFIKFAGTSTVYWPLAAARFPAVVLMAIAALFSKEPSGFSARIVRLALTAGILDTLGNVCFIRATQTGRLDIAAVLSALYPAMTVALAFFVLKERVTRMQYAGIAAALISVPLIAA